MSIPFVDEPGHCPDPETTPGSYMGDFCATNFTSGPAAGKFCWDRQADYSAFRESSFGYGIFEVLFPANPSLCALQHSIVVEKLHSINCFTSYVPVYITWKTGKHSNLCYIILGSDAIKQYSSATYIIPYLDLSQNRTLIFT